MTLPKKNALLPLFAILSFGCDPAAEPEPESDTPDAQLQVPEQYETISAALEVARDGDVVVVSPGEYAENVDFAGKAVTVRSTAPDDEQVVSSTVISGVAGGCVITFESGETRASVLEGLTIRGGRGDRNDLTEGGGVCVRNGAAPTIRGNVITNNDAYRGGGISVIAASPLIESNSIVGNEAEHRGAAIYVAEGSEVEIRANTLGDNAGGSGAVHVTDEGSSAHIEGNTIAGNTTDYGAGGLHVSFGASATIVDNVVSNNTGNGDGSAGGVTIERATATVVDNEIVGNVKEGGTGGAGVEISGHHTGAAQATLAGNEITYNVNRSSSGGAVSVRDHASATLEGNLIAGNETVAWGGGVFVYNLGEQPDGSPHAVEIRDNVIRDNHVTGIDSGGGIAVRGPALATIEGNLIAENVASVEPVSGTRSGGGISIQLGGAVVSVFDNELEHNSAAGWGGGIYVGQDATIVDRSGEPWTRANSGPADEPNNTYTGNAHSDTCGHDVFFEELRCD